jgi:hypothetical protein
MLDLNILILCQDKSQEDEPMEEQKREEEVTEQQPEIYTVKKDLTGWRFDRRTFLAAAGTTAAIAAVGTATSCGQPTPQEQVVIVDVVATPSFTPPPAQNPVSPPPQSPQSTTSTAATEAPTSPGPSDTPVPSSTVAPSDTPTPETPQAEFVKDVTIPDGTEMKPNQPFVKTWRYRNSGSMPWGDGVQLVFVEGSVQGTQSNKMGGPDFVGVPNVAPGDTVDISVNLVAPAKESKYRSYWRLKLPSGEWLENNHYAEIVVKKPATATPVPPSPTVPPACGCDGVCECEGYCGQHSEPKPTKEKHYWHPN